MDSIMLMFHFHSHLRLLKNLEVLLKCLWFEFSWEGRAVLGRRKGFLYSESNGSPFKGFRSCVLDDFIWPFYNQAYFSTWNFSVSCSFFFFLIGWHHGPSPEGLESRRALLLTHSLNPVISCWGEAGAFEQGNKWSNCAGLWSFSTGFNDPSYRGCYHSVAHSGLWIKC